jgi:hypothetical protein
MGDKTPYEWSGKPVTAEQMALSFEAEQHGFHDDLCAPAAYLDCENPAHEYVRGWFKTVWDTAQAEAPGG